MKRMPFTPAHAAAVLPFQRTRLITSALVIGSFSPDFEYFLRFAPQGNFGHTFVGLFAFDLPVALLVFWLYQAYAREPILAWLPRKIRLRMPSRSILSSIWNARGMALVLISILIGAATHIIWDSFTHRSFWPYHHWHFLSHTIQLPVIGTVQYFKLLQYISTIAGLVALLIWFWYWYRHTASLSTQTTCSTQENERKVLVALCIGTIIAAPVRGLLGLGIPRDQHQVEILLAEIASTAITIFWIGVVVYGIWRAQKHSRPKDA